MDAAKFALKQQKKKELEKSYPLHLMLALPTVLLVIFGLGSLVGLVMAFQNYLPGQGWYVFGSEFVGFANFKRIFTSPEIWDVLRNTIVISLLKIVVGTIVPIVLAILINEVIHKFVKKTVQTLIFIPYFISWVILGGIFSKLFAQDGGIIANLIPGFPDLLGDAKYFRGYVLLTAVWKGAGYTTLIHLAAITTINPTLYEAASIDGASKLKQCFSITIPGIMPSILLMSVLNMGSILSAGFDQVYVLYNEMVYATGDILDTYIYRLAFEGASDYGLSTAASLFKSAVSTIFVSISYWVAYKKFGYKVL